MSTIFLLIPAHECTPDIFGRENTDTVKIIFLHLPHGGRTKSYFQSLQIYNIMTSNSSIDESSSPNFKITGTIDLIEASPPENKFQNWSPVPIPKMKIRKFYQLSKT